MSKGNLCIFVGLLLALSFFGTTITHADERPFYTTNQTLKYGMSDGSIFGLQSYLVDSGIYPRELIIGYFGKITQLAIIAHANDFPIFTQAETLDELIKNIQEATDLHFLDEDSAVSGLSHKPSLLVNFEIPQYASAHRFLH